MRADTVDKMNGYVMGVSDRAIYRCDFGDVDCVDVGVEGIGGWVELVDGALEGVEGDVTVDKGGQWDTPARLGGERLGEVLLLRVVAMQPHRQAQQYYKPKDHRCSMFAEWG